MRQPSDGETASADALLSPPDGGAYMTTGEVAKVLHVSPKTVARWATDGKLPHLITLGGHRRFPAAAIHELAHRLNVAS